MLNVDLIDKLYSELPKEKQQQLVIQLFKKSRQSMAYFRRTKDISLSKLEILADFFKMPLDYFRLGSELFERAAHIEAKDNIFAVGSYVSTGAGLLIKNQALQQQLADKEELLNEKKEEELNEKKKELKEKDERIKSMESMMTFMNDAMNGVKGAIETKDAYIKTLEETVASLKRDMATLTTR